MTKIGRNDPCPCGSGKKFKQCHLGRQDELVFNRQSDFTLEMSKRITSLQEVYYGRSKEIIEALELQKLTGSAMGIKCIDLAEYQALDLSGQPAFRKERAVEGALLVNVHKTKLTDPDNIYMAITAEISDGVLVHELAHVLDFLGGSRLPAGLARPLSYELEIPIEHLEHPYEFGYWLDYLQREFDVDLDADDAIIHFLYRYNMLIRGVDVQGQKQSILKAKSQSILRFLSKKSSEIDAMICKRPGYIGSRVKSE
jgi:hypothetical protein